MINVVSHAADVAGVEDEKMTVTCSTGLKTVDPIQLRRGVKQRYLEG